MCHGWRTGHLEHAIPALTPALSSTERVNLMTVIDTFDLLTMPPVEQLGFMATSLPDSPDRVIEYQLVTPCGQLLTRFAFVQLTMADGNYKLFGVTELDEHGSLEQRYATATFTVNVDPDDPLFMSDGFVEVHGEVVHFDTPAVRALRDYASLATA